MNVDRYDSKHSNRMLSVFMALDLIEEAKSEGIELSMTDALIAVLTDSVDDFSERVFPYLDDLEDYLNIINGNINDIYYII